MSQRPIFEHVSGKRLWQRIEALAAFGAREDGGVDRQALSEQEIGARAQLVVWGRQIGLRPYTDDIGNLFLRLEGMNPDLDPVMSGSHIDSQPTGGKFDGAFGVLAALEALEAMVEAGHKPLRSIEVVAWTNEEGSRFAPGMNGSTAFCFPCELPTILDIRDADGISVSEAVASILKQDVNVPLRPLGRKPACFIEAHIEQGPVLEKAEVPLGVVSGIQGTRRYRVKVTGKAAHAGTEPMEERQDALLAAVDLIARMHQAAAAIDNFKFTVGHMKVEPNAPSVVPSEAYFSIDIRHPDNEAVETMDRSIRKLVAESGSPCTIDLQQIAQADSITFAEPIRAMIEDAATAANVPHMTIYSSAGHDARQLHAVCPTGMIFIPCRGGISHNPDEWSEPEHVEQGAKVLTEALVALSSG
jgi:N-carbamoyl-L-amino-acid hydrolase